MSNFTKLIRNRSFVLYCAGQAFSQFGDRLVQIVLIGYVYQKWPGSTLELAKLFSFTVLPSFFISPIAGVYIDRWNKTYVMVLSDIFRALTILLIPLFLIYQDNIAPIYGVIFLIFTAACFFLPARLAVIPSLVSREDILIANSASTIVWVIAGVVGFSLGGFLVEWTGIKNSLYLNSIVYFLSAASFLCLIYSIKSRKHAERDKNTIHSKKTFPEKSFLHDLVVGLKELFTNGKIRFVMCAFFIFASVVGACYIVVIVFIQETLKTMTQHVGLFGMCIFAGALISSYIYGKMDMSFSRIKTVFISVFFVGISVSAFAISLKSTGSFLLGAAFAFLIGFFLSPVYVTANTIVHETIRQDLRGRIFSSLGIVMNIGFLSFMFLSSILTEHVGNFLILVFCGSVFALFGLIGFVAVSAGRLKDFTSFS
ncbi:MAG: MFS transporter [Omnitrophica bacterium]|nr:MFS transporter [Candidatus Omnitrophota bacterium]